VVLLHGKYIEGNGMKIIKTFLKIVGGGIFLFLLWPMWEFWGVDIVRDIKCGPSESITKPMAEAIVREINKRGTRKKIVRLDSLESLPYALVECKNAIFDKLKKENYDYMQTCTFYDKKKKYAVRLEYTNSNSIYVYIYKIDVGKFDFTEIIYRAEPFINDDKYVYTDKWHIRKSTLTHYSKQSKGDCRYRSPIRP